MSVLLKQIIEALEKYVGVPSSLFKEFIFVAGETPLSSIQYPLLTTFAYCVGIPMLQKFMENRKDPPLKIILVFHNLFLTLASAFVAFMMILALMSFQEKGYSPKHIYCSLSYYDQKGTLTLLYYVNYLLKYYELLDTVFLALKHKPIGFLHAYHHPATLVLTWGQLVDATGVQWVVILLNLFVHTVMYFYYFMAALHIPVPFKQSVTIMQIIQFILDLIACYCAWSAKVFLGRCVGTFRAGLVGCFILTSYLYLFIDFYYDTYSTPTNKKKTKEE